MSAPSGPLRVVLIGAGSMGRNWLELLHGSSPAVELVGIADIQADAARAAAAQYGGVPSATSLTALLKTAPADAVVNATVPGAHHAVNSEAMFLGLPVLCEKPLAPTVSEALSLVATAELTGQLLMTSQSRRYYPALTAFKAQVEAFGGAELLTTQFFRAPHFGGFREEMAHPLLVDMAIHAFDAARFILGQEPSRVFCDEFNPSWSWFAEGAAASAIFEFSGGSRFSYEGSWCSPGFETSWNGEWRASGPGGTALWDGEHPPRSSVEHEPAAIDLESGPKEIAGALDEFVAALRTGSTPWGEVHSNVLSLAMVESAVRSASTHESVAIDDVLAVALSTAIAAEQRDDVRSLLESWTDPGAALRGEVRA